MEEEKKDKPTSAPKPTTSADAKAMSDKPPTTPKPTKPSEPAKPVQAPKPTTPSAPKPVEPPKPTPTPQAPPKPQPPKPTTPPTPKPVEPPKPTSQPPVMPKMPPKPVTTPAPTGQPLGSDNPTSASGGDTPEPRFGKPSYANIIKKIVSVVILVGAILLFVEAFMRYRGTSLTTLIFGEKKKVRRKVDVEKYKRIAQEKGLAPAAPTKAPAAKPAKPADKK